MRGRTKIVATVGPASESPERLAELILAGVDVFRLNLSHGSLAGHLQRLADIRAAAERTGRTVAVLADLPGPKVRCAPFPDGGVVLADGAEVLVASGDTASSTTRVEVEYPALANDLAVGDQLILGDGAIRLRIVGVDVGQVRAVVESGGRVQGRPGAHLPSERTRLRAPTDEDLELAAAMMAADVDFLAVSFVRGAADLAPIRAMAGDWRGGLVAKIETAPAVAALDEIVAASDAVMVARGDLGIECPLEDVPHLQKRIVRHCVAAGVPVITATQMLESMITSPAPTRAEVSDVANAVFDGTDAVMLSGETAIGVSPGAVVRTMARIAERAEEEAEYGRWAARLGRQERPGLPELDDTARITWAMTRAAHEAAHDIGAAAVLCCTRSGRTARAMARFRPAARLLGVSPDPHTVRALALTWGVEPLLVDVYTTADELVWFAVERALNAGLLQHGDTALVLAGAPDGSTRGAADMLRVVHLA